jgi:hypothetical protein
MGIEERIIRFLLRFKWFDKFCNEAGRIMSEDNEAMIRSIFGYHPNDHYDPSDDEANCTREKSLHC